MKNQPRLFTVPKTLPSHVVIYDFHPETNTFVVLAQAPTSIPASKKRPALLRHKPGHNPQLEAKALARYLDKKEHGSGSVVVA